MFLSADQLELLQEAINTLGRVDVDSVSLAFLMQKLEQPLGVLTRFDLRSVWKVVRGLLVVQVYEVGQSNVANLTHHTLNIILWYRQLVQVHGLGPKKNEVSILQMPIWLTREIQALIKEISWHSPK